VLGPNWLGAIPVITILAFSGTLMVMESNVAYVFYALGRPRVTSVLMVGYVLVLLPLLVLSTWNAGAIGAAWAHLVTWVLFVPISFAVVLRYLGLAFRTFFQAVWRIIVAAAGMSAVVQALLTVMMANRVPASLSLVTAILAGAGAYSVATLALWHLARKPAGVERIVIDFAAGRLVALRGTSPAAPVHPPD
jgi:O-antigen/teichoic acid export membrane protein